MFKHPTGWDRITDPDLEHELARMDGESLCACEVIASLEALQARASGERILLQRDPLGRMYL